MQNRHLVSHAEAAEMWRRAGYSPEQISNVLRDLPDPIDSERDAETLFKLGVSVGTIMDRLGSSP